MSKELSAVSIRQLLSNGLGAKGDEEVSPVLYPERPLHVLLLATGSVASIKVPLIVARLLEVSLWTGDDEQAS